MELPFDDYELFDEVSRIALVRPNALYLEDYRVACEETWDHIHNRYILHDPQLFDHWKHTLFDTFERRFRGECLPSGYYPSLMLWGVRAGGQHGSGCCHAREEDRDADESRRASRAGNICHDGFLREGDARFIGAVNIRLEQDEDLISYGGTYGYFVRTSERGHGYGIALGKLGLRAAQLMGVDPIVITLQESNTASLALAEHLPSVRKERDVVSVDGVVQPIWRYWLSDSAR